MHQGKVVSFYQDGSLDIIVHPGAVGILPVDQEGKLLLIRQWRHPVQRDLLEIPAGCLEPSESILDCAQRELQEEAGVRAGTLIPLGGIYTAPGFCTEYIHLFLAQDLLESSLPPDESEDITVIPTTLEEAERKAQSGDLCDGKTLTALYLYKLWLSHLTR